MSDQNQSLDRRLAGRTLQVYLYLQKKRGASGIRQVQRDLGLSSPSVAEYQVEKLIEMGLARRDSHGRVFITRKVTVKAMASYINFGRFIVPRLTLYAIFFSAIAATYVIFSFGSLNLYGVAAASGAAAIFWFEACKLWKVRPFERTKEPVERDYFWISLMPGLAALAAFVAGAFFLFYYVEPNSPASAVPPLPNPDTPLFQSNSRGSLPIDELHVLTANEGDPWSSLMPQVIALLSTGGLVAGFIIYLMVKYRRNQGVLWPEQEQN